MTSEQPHEQPDQQADDSSAAYAHARTQLGERLAVFRSAAGLTRQQFADKMGRALSAIGRAETGQGTFEVDFWRTADHLLNTGGVLAVACLPVAELRRKARAARARSVAAHEATTRCLSPQACLCLVAVAHWTRLEIQALRTALRYDFPDWAYALHTSLETVHRWESTHGQPPRLNEQHQFDEIVERMELSARARFRLLLAAGRSHTPPHAAAGPVASYTVAPHDES